MILRSRPKNGYGPIAASIKRLSQFHCGKGLVYGVKRSSKEAGLLPSNNRNSLRVAEPLDIVKCLVPGPDLEFISISASASLERSV